MNWKRIRYFLFTIFFLGLTLLLAYGLKRAPDPRIAEFGILAIVLFTLMYFMGRESDKEDETAGIISFDDDD
ncbi:MAG: hypothetical protein ACI8T1_000228 [Verrucomicrobiales bacterium]|jgi:hypothetical protein